MGQGMWEWWFCSVQYCVDFSGSLFFSLGWDRRGCYILEQSLLLFPPYHLQSGAGGVWLRTLAWFHLLLFTGGEPSCWGFGFLLSNEWVLLWDQSLMVPLTKWTVRGFCSNFKKYHQYHAASLQNAFSFSCLKVTLLVCNCLIWQHIKSRDFSILRSISSQISDKLEDALGPISFLGTFPECQIMSRGPILQAVLRGGALLKCIWSEKKPAFAGNTL